MKGSIRKRGTNKYQLIVTIGSDYRGKPRRFYKTITAKSEKDAEMELAVFYNECEKNRVAAACNIKFCEFVEIWSNEYAKTQLKKSTFVSYMRNLNKNFDMFNGKKLNQIKPFHVRQWITYLSGCSLSPKTVKNNYTLLRSILHKAVQWEYIEKNPAEDIELPQVKHKESGYYTSKEVVSLLNVLDNVEEKYMNYKVAVLLGLFGGLRRGEIFGINESDINFSNNTVKIQHTRMIYGTGGLYTDLPKTDSSLRMITLPKGVINEIHELLKYQKKQSYEKGNVWKSSDALLKNEIGAPLYPPSLYRWFVKLQKENGLPHLSVHGLRHTHTAMLRDCDMKLENVSQRLGHAQKSTTLNIYSHLFSDKDDEVSRKLDEKFWNKEK